MNAQDLQSAAIAWVLQGVEKQGGAFVDMTIVGSTAALASGSSWRGPPATIRADDRHTARVS